MRVGVCLEAVDVSGVTPRRIDGAWISPVRVRGLLDRLLANMDGDLGQPSMAWDNGVYVYHPEGAPAGGDAGADITSADPIVARCVDAREVQVALSWIQTAVAPGGAFNRPDVWTWLSFEGKYEPEAFSAAFESELADWLRICNLALESGGKVIQRVDA